MRPIALGTSLTVKCLKNVFSVGRFSQLTEIIYNIISLGEAT